MGADDCERRTEADALADDSAALLAQKQAGSLPPDALDRAADITARAATAYRTDRAQHEPAMGALVNTAALLSGAGRLGELVPHALAVLGHPTDWPGRDAAWRDLVYNALFGAMDRSPPERVLEVLDLARQAALHDPARMALWAALADATRDAGKALGNVGRWDLHDRLEPFLEGAPDAIAATRAELLADGVVLALSRKENARAEEMHGRLRTFSASKPSAAIAAHHAVALEVLLTGNEPEPFLEPRKIVQLVDEQLTLVDRWPDDREVARALTSSAGTVLTLLEVLEDDLRHAGVVQRLAGLARRWPGDEELHFNSARAIVNAGIVHVNERRKKGMIAWIANLLGGNERVFDRLKSALVSLSASCPTSANIADARERFERATGRAVPAPAGARPAPNPDIIRLSAAFDALQREGAASPGPVGEMNAVLGEGRTLPRVQREGAGVYARDERYFLDLLEELGRQISVDRTGFWKSRVTVLEAQTRFLIEDGTDAIAFRAGELRTQMKMPPRKRKGAA